MSEAHEVTARTEVRDGMRITWHQPIAVDDGLVLRADVYRPIADGRYPVILTYGIYAKGLAYPGWVPAAVGEDDRRPPGNPGRLHQQVPELGNHRPGALGSSWLCRRARGLARGRLVPRIHGSGLRQGNGGSLPVHRVGRDAALEQRQGGHAGDFLLCQQPVAGGHHVPAPPGGHHPLGRSERSLPRFRLPRGHSQPVPGALGQAPGRQRAVRAWRQGQEEPQHRGVGGGAHDSLRRGAGQEPGGRLRGAQEASARRSSGTGIARRISPRYARRS